MMQLADPKGHYQDLIANLLEVLIPNYSLRSQRPAGASCFMQPLVDAAKAPCYPESSATVASSNLHPYIYQRHATRSPRRFTHGHRSNAQSL
jgi:hypothetical protein